MFTIRVHAFVTVSGIPLAFITAHLPQLYFHAFSPLVNVSKTRSLQPERGNLYFPFDFYIGKNPPFLPRKNKQAW
jgi:hypothetical protein